MVSSLSSSLSALNAFDKKMGVTAHNVANVNTDDFKKSRAVLKEGQNKSVEVDISKVNTEGYPKPDAAGKNGEPKELSNVDLAQEMTSLITTQRGYEANLKPVEAYDEMTGTVIDIKS